MQIAFSSQCFIKEPFIQEDDHLIFSNLYYNIFIYDLLTNTIVAITYSPYDHEYPTWAKDQQNIVYSAYRDSVSNIFVYDFKEKAIAQLTNIFSGTFSPCVSGDNTEMVFSSFYKMGWDLYLYSNPLDSLNYITYQEPQTIEDNPFDEVFHLREFRRFYRPREKLITKKSRFDSDYSLRRIHWKPNRNIKRIKSPKSRSISSSSLLISYLEGLLIQRVMEFQHKYMSP